MESNEPLTDNLLQGVFDLLQEGIVITDPRGKILSANSRMGTLTGYSALELQKCYLHHLICWEGVHPSEGDVSRMWSFFSKATRETLAGSLRGKHGKILPAQLQAQKIACNGHDGNYLVTISDLTEVTSLRKEVHDLEAKLESLRSEGGDCLLEKEEWEIVQLEARLQETENYLEHILRTSGECVIVTDSNNTIVRINAALVDTLGYGIEELLSNPLSNIMPLMPGSYISTTEDMIVIGDEFLALYEKTQSSILREGRHEYEMYLLQKCGKIVPVEMSTTLLYDEEGKRNGTVSVGRDVSDRKKMYEALKRAKEKAEDATRYKSEFLANMSHEIRTPMNAVLGFTAMLLETALDSEQKDYVQTVQQSAQALLALINDILDFSKLEAGKMHLEEIDFDPEELSYDICDLIKTKMEGKDIELLCRVSDDIPSSVKGDAIKVRQVLVNLMDNAVKFTHQGEIELSLEKEEETEEHVKLHAKVRDSGIGIPHDKLKSIFKMFQQADGSTTRKFGGTGLGLSICKGISQAMAGDVWAESLTMRELRHAQSSSGDPGSIFHFTACFKKSDKPSSCTTHRRSLAGKKVMIVDKNQHSRGILNHLFRAVGARVTVLAEAEKLQETLLAALHADDSFDICMVDIHMPVISGYDVVRMVRQNEKLTTLPLVALASFPLAGARQCREAGFNGFLTKPVRRQKLLDMVDELLTEKEEQGVSCMHSTSDRCEQREETIPNDHTTVKEIINQSTRILLVEDNVVNRKLAITMLTQSGYQVETASNGKEAVALYKLSAGGDGKTSVEKSDANDGTKENGRYNLIFMDVQMPVMDGLTATQEIRKWEQGKGCHIPVIAMTANAMEGDKEKCLEAGMDDYVAKPIRREDVFELVEKWKRVCA
jgi:PAS domain S-box-containing protein